jgi:hypothetical protein
MAFAYRRSDGKKNVGKVLAVLPRIDEGMAAKAHMLIWEVSCNVDGL